MSNTAVNKSENQAQIDRDVLLVEIKEALLSADRAQRALAKDDAMSRTYPIARSAIPRGKIQEFRQHLNALPQTTKHKHNQFHQRTRSYGDYLYYQDREKFMVDLHDWLAASCNNHT